MTIAVAQVVPQSVEKLPLFHWRPGGRVLVVGARDGARFDGAQQGDEGSFKRPLDDALLASALQRSGCTGLAAAWSNSLREADGLALLQATRVPLVMICSGHGDAALVDALLAEVDAWLLLTGAEPGPAASRILESGRHVELLWAVDDEPRLPELPLAQARAVHVCNRRQADPSDRFDAARALLPAGLAAYDGRHQHTACPCGETLVWRSGGRSRLDALDAEAGSCRACGRPAEAFTLG